MGLFWKAAKVNPKITVDAIEFEFDRNLEYWAFTYRGTQFQSFDPTLTVPANAELDEILRTVELLTPEMKSRLKSHLSEWDTSLLDGRESYTVDVDKFLTEATFEVSWSSESWGDLGAYFTIKDRVIMDEDWAD